MVMASTDETGHYPLALEDWLRSEYVNVHVKDRKEFFLYAGRILATEYGGYRPLPAARLFHQSMARYRWALGGNRSSKSRALATEVFWYATGLHPWKKIRTPNTGWFCTLTWEKVGDTLWPNLKRLLTGFDVEIVWHNRQRDIPERLYVKTTFGTSKIIFKAYEQGRDTFQAVALRYAAMDEQFPQDIFIEITTRIGAEQALDFMAALTPIVPQTWLEQRLELGHNPNDEVFNFPLDDNRISRGGFISDEEIDAAIENWPVEVRETRRNGKWGGFAGAVFQTFSKSIHVVGEDKEQKLFFPNPLKFQTWDSIGCIDWGGNNPFVYLWAVRVPQLDNDWYVYDEYYWNFQVRGPRRLEQHADEIKSRNLKWKNLLVRSWADHDPTDASEMAHYDVPSNPADKTDKLAGIERLQTLFAPRGHLTNPDFPFGRPRIFVAARCINTIRELQGYRWREGTEDRDAPREPIKKDDHTVDALRMLVSSEQSFDADGASVMPVSLGGQFARRF